MPVSSALPDVGIRSGNRGGAADAPGLKERVLAIVDPGTTIGVVGYGLLGAVIARRLLDADIDVAIIDSDPARRAVARAEGINVTDTVPALSNICSSIVVVLYSTVQVADLLEALDGLERSDATVLKTILCVTTLDPDRVSELYDKAEQLGFAFIECPISGTCAQVADGEAFGLLAGTPQAIDDTKSLVEAIVPQAIYCGPPGSAARTKLAINLVLELNRSALAEGLVFANVLGLDLARFVQTLKLSAASSRVIDSKATKMIHDDFLPQGRCHQSLKDVELMIGLAGQAGQTLPLTNVQAALLSDCVAFGEGALDSAAVISAIRRVRTPIPKP